MRQDQPLFHDTVVDSWILTRYADVEAVFKDFERYSNTTYTHNTGAVLGTTLLEMDGMDHVVRRSIVAPEFVGKRLDAYADVIDRNALDLIEPWRTDGHVDLVDRFTTRLPINVIVDMLALPKDDHHLFHEWYTAMMAGLGAASAAPGRARPRTPRCAPTSTRTWSSGSACPARTCCRRSPTARPRASGSPTPRSSRFVSLMLVAGGETTDKAISNLWWNLLTHPDALAAVTADPDRLDACFSETMRKDGPVQFEDRFTTTEVEWYGQTIPAGARVRVCVASANSDETVFERTPPLRARPARTCGSRSRSAWAPTPTTGAPGTSASASASTSASATSWPAPRASSARSACSRRWPTPASPPAPTCGRRSSAGSGPSPTCRSTSTRAEGTFPPMGTIVEFASNGEHRVGLPGRRRRAGPGRASSWSRSGGASTPASRRWPTASAPPGFVALAPDLYHGELAGHDEMDKAGQLMQTLPPDRAARDMSGAVDYLAGLDAVTGDGLGVVGFCMGGMLSLLLAAMRPDQIKAAVPFYGFPQGDAEPDWSGLTAAVPGPHGRERRLLRPRGGARRSRRSCRAWARTSRFTVHPGTGHAFMGPHNALGTLDEEAGRIWPEVVAFLHDGSADLSLAARRRDQHVEESSPGDRPRPRAQRPASHVRCPLDVEGIQAAHDRARVVVEVVGAGHQAQAGQPAHQRVERQPALEPGQVGTEAEVDAGAEVQRVLGVGAAHVEHVGIRPSVACRGWPTP